MHLTEEHPDAATARATLLVVALGRTPRLLDCLTSLVRHEARTPFRIVCVVNPGESDAGAASAIAALPVTVADAPLNLGWAGGLHLARARASTELLAWLQDDMVVLPGWLDALVEAADAHPEVGAFGSVRVDAHGEVQLFNGGWAVPGDVRRWSSTDTSITETPTGVTRLDWVTSRGLMLRAAAWDSIGGPDPSLYPLTFVDLDTCTHLRAHGWGVALVADSTTLHTGNQASPGLLREYLDERLSPRVDERWAAVTATLTRGAAAEHPHDCTRDRADDVEGWVAREATDIVVRFGRWAEQTRRAETDALRARLTETELSAYQSSAELAAVRVSRSWRLTAPLRALRHRRGSPPGT